jgi:hypothetical protein
VKAGAPSAKITCCLVTYNYFSADASPGPIPPPQRTVVYLSRPVKSSDCPACLGSTTDRNTTDPNVSLARSLFDQALSYGKGTQISIENMCKYVMKFNVSMFPRHFLDVRMFSYRGVCFQNIVYLLVVIHRFRMCHTPSS